MTVSAIRGLTTRLRRTTLYGCLKRTLRLRRSYMVKPFQYPQTQTGSKWVGSTLYPTRSMPTAAIWAGIWSAYWRRVIGDRKTCLSCDLITSFVHIVKSIPQRMCIFITAPKGAVVWLPNECPYPEYDAWKQFQRILTVRSSLLRNVSRAKRCKHSRKRMWNSEAGTHNDADEWLSMACSLNDINLRRQERCLRVYAEGSYFLQL